MIITVELIALFLLGSLFFAISSVIWLIGQLCCRCHIRRASLEIGDHWVCRRCWDWLEEKRQMLENLDAALDADSAEKAMRYRQDVPPWRDGE